MLWALGTLHHGAEQVRQAMAEGLAALHQRMARVEDRLGHLEGAVAALHPPPPDHPRPEAPLPPPPSDDTPPTDPSSDLPQAEGAPPAAPLADPGSDA